VKGDAVASQTKQDDAGQAAVEKKVAAAEEKGYLGVKVDPLPNSAHSLESGPDAPPVHEAQRNIDIADLTPEA
jgi:hypothetical protein